MVETRHSTEEHESEQLARSRGAVPARGRVSKGGVMTKQASMRSPSLMERTLGANEWTYTALMTVRARTAAACCPLG